MGSRIRAVAQPATAIGWAAGLGHTIVAPRPALVPILVDAEWLRDLQGITVPDVRLQVIAPPDGPPGGDAGAKSAKVLLEGRGSMLFAHFGLSGPVALDVSRAVSALPRGRRPLLRCDFLPGVKSPQYEAMLAAAAAESGRRLVASLIERWLPRRLADALVAQAQVPADRRAAEFSRPERLRLVQAVKQLDVATTGTLGFEKAEVTAGGVSLDEVDSHTHAEHAGSAACSSRASCSTSTARSAATTFRPPSAPATWPARACRS